MDNLTSRGGGLDIVRTCQSVALAGYPLFIGNNEAVNEVCMKAFTQAFDVVGASEALNNFRTSSSRPRLYRTNC